MICPLTSESVVARQRYFPSRGDDEPAPPPPEWLGVAFVLEGFCSLLDWLGLGLWRQERFLSSTTRRCLGGRRGGTCALERPNRHRRFVLQACKLMTCAARKTTQWPTRQAEALASQHVCCKQAFSSPPPPPHRHSLFGEGLFQACSFPQGFSNCDTVTPPKK